VIEQGDYGPVRVVGGKHRGKVGYYDDDELDKDDKAVVYFGEPFGSEAALISYGDLERLKGPALPLEKFVRQNPETARRFGVVSSRK